MSKVSAPMESADILPKEVEVKLGANSYERRKSAAHDIENLIKALVEKGDVAKINALITFLGDEFVHSPSPNYRKGGLIGLAACAIGLVDNAKVYLDLLVEPVFKCFDDPAHFRNFDSFCIWENASAAACRQCSSKRE